MPEPEPVDPQFVELFIEEAKEEIASIQKSFPQWDQNPMDLESLSSMRRSFHTLKGSGRMVGARSIAEFGWSIENLLNRIIDKTLSRTPGNDGAAAQLGRRTAAIGGTAGDRTARSRARSTTLMARAFAYADGREADQGHGDGGAGGHRFDAGADRAGMPHGGRRATARSPGCCGAHGRGAAGHGSRAARHLQQGDLEPFDRDPRILAQAHRSARAA